MKPVSKQRRWQLKMVAAGRCSQCGKARKSYKDLCNACAVKRRALNRRQVGCRPQAAGKRGRPPFVRGLE